jgi:hypothetical protein
MMPFQFWDNHSVIIDANTRSATHGAMSLVLATQPHEVQMLQTLRNASANMVYNGAPWTRTWSETFRPSDAMYLAETVSHPLAISFVSASD